MGRQTSKTLPDETSTEYKYYDDFGRLYYFEDFEGQITGYFYNDLGQLWVKNYYDSANDYPDTPAESVEYTYDDLGRTVQVEKDDGVSTRTTDYYYDAEGRLIQVDSPEGIINYEYNSVTGRKTRTYTDDSKVITDYAYDDLGRLQTVEDNKTSQDNTYGYNAVGSRQSIQLSNDAYTKYDYDNCNRLTELVNYKDNTMAEILSQFAYTLYADGMRARVEEHIRKTDGSTIDEQYIDYHYDNLNRIRYEVANDEDVVITFDGEGKPDNGIMNNGYFADYRYDLVGNRKSRSLLIYNGGTKVSEHHTDYVYDSNGTDRLTKETIIDNAPLYTMGERDNLVYVYASADGEISYRIAGVNGDIGGLRAFFRGLPSKWNQYAYAAAGVMLLLAFFGPYLMRLFRMSFLRRQGQESRQPLSRFGLFTRGLCLFLACTFFIGTHSLQVMADGSYLYDDLQNQVQNTWGQYDTDIHYTYDDNGSLTKKVKAFKDEPIPNDNYIEMIEYFYNLQNRLQRVETTPWGQSTQIVEYVYNDAGIKVQKIDDPDGAPVVTTYLIDSNNPTGYAQVLTETTGSATRTYTLGDDVIAQSNTPGTDTATQYLLYDGHGSTRQLTDSLIDDTDDIIESHSYDAYGMRLGGNPSSPTATNLLYTGEQFDTDLQQYYLRARYYDPSNGRFNRIDPYSGNNQDPQSLHKYLYCHANPANAIDPTGLFSYLEMLVVSGIVACLVALIAGEIAELKGYTEEKANEIRFKAFLIGFLATASIYATIWAIHSLWLVACSGGGYGSLQYAQQYRIDSYNKLSRTLSGTGLRAHHIIEQRFARLFGMSSGEMPAVAVTKAEHAIFTGRWQQAIGYRNWNVPLTTNTATKEDLWLAAQKIYAEYPVLLETCKLMLQGEGG